MICKQNPANHNLICNIHVNLDLCFQRPNCVWNQTCATIIIPNNTCKKWNELLFSSRLFRLKLGINPVKQTNVKTQKTHQPTPYISVASPRGHRLEPSCWCKKWGLVQNNEPTSSERNTNMMPWNHHRQYLCIQPTRSAEFAIAITNLNGNSLGIDKTFPPNHSHFSSQFHKSHKTQISNKQLLTLYTCLCHTYL